MAQRRSSVSCTQRTPAGLPCGMPGMGEEIEGAMQHAPQPARQSIAAVYALLAPRRGDDSARVKVGDVLLRVVEGDHFPIAVVPQKVQHGQIAHTGGRVKHEHRRGEYGHVGP